MEKASLQLGIVEYPNKQEGSKRMSTGFVGNYIHETSMGGWHNHHKRQRQSKLTRHHRNRNNRTEEKNTPLSGETQEEGVMRVRSSESGYDTTGDPQVPRVSGEEEKKATKKEEVFLNVCSMSSHAGGLDDGNDSKNQDFVNMKDVESSSLRKLLRDLNRCDVSLRRYQNSLQQVSKTLLLL